MKFFLLLAACAFTFGAASAQTVAPGTTPGAQTGNPSNMPSAGTTTPDQSMNNGRMDNSSKMDRSNKRMMRKGGKMKTNSDGTMMKTKEKM